MKPAASRPSAKPKLDLTFVRSCFPAFAQPLPAKTAFFENAGGSYVVGAVLDKLLHFYRNNKVQPYGASEIGVAAGEQMDRGRQTMAALLGVPMATLTLGPSTTQNINSLAIACAGIVGGKQADGNAGAKLSRKIMVTGQDHEANIGAWERLCRRTGAELIVWEADPRSGELSLTDLRRLLDRRVKIVCMTHSSNILGSLNPVAEVIELCRKNGSKIILDGVSYAPHQLPQIGVLQPDAYCFSAYKTYATHLGVMYIAPQFADALQPQCHDFNRDCAHKLFDTAGPDHASIAALAGLGDYFAASYQYHFGADADSASSHKTTPSLHQQAIAVSKLMHQHETELCAPLLAAIEALPLRIIGRNSMQNREANIALVSEQYSSQQLATALAKKHIATGYGHFYAKRLLEAVGIKNSEDGVLRISFAHYNTEQEVSRLINALQELF